MITIDETVTIGVSSTEVVVVESWLTPTYVLTPLLDHNGNPVLDDNGDPIMTRVLV